MDHLLYYCVPWSCKVFESPPLSSNFIHKQGSRREASTLPTSIGLVWRMQLPSEPAHLCGRWPGDLSSRDGLEPRGSEGAGLLNGSDAAY